MSNVDPVQYFENDNLYGSIVKSIAHRPESHRLIFIVGYVNINWILSKVRGDDPPPPEPERKNYNDWRRLDFQGVSGLVRRRTRIRQGFRGFDRSNLNYSSFDNFSTEIEAIWIRATETGFAGKVALGSLGDYEFKFESLDVAQKLARGVLVGHDEWEYFDDVSGAKVDIYDPFPEQSN